MERVFGFLKKGNVCVVATTSGDKPRSSVIEYYMVGNAVIFATSPSSIKANNLKSNNHISMTVHAMPQFVTVDGSVTEPTQVEIESYMQQLLVHHPEFVEMMKSGMMEPFSFYKLVIDTAYYNDYSKGMAPTEIIKG